MGNTESSQVNEKKEGATHSIKEGAGSHKAGAGDGKSSHAVRKVPSGGASAKHAAPPTASLISSSSGSASTSTSNAQAQATVSASSSPISRRSHNRARSVTVPASQPKTSSLTDAAVAGSSHTSDSPSTVAMGNSESKLSHQSPPPSRSNALSDSPSAATSASDKLSSSSISPPVAVPFHPVQDSPRDDLSPSAYPASPYGLPPANYSRPPRLPLPIEEEVHVPGSPIISPQDILSPLDADDVEGAFPRRASVTSSALDEDEEGGEIDIFGYDTVMSGPKVPYTFEWHGDGDKIFVTGTFVGWQKKLKLHKNKEGKPHFSATVNLPPGTHHLKFLVGNDMVISPHLPTTVDWGNILVNYIEIVAQTADDKQPPVPSQPMPIPGAAIAAGQAVPADEPGTARPKTQLPETAISPAEGVTQPPTVTPAQAPQPINIPGGGREAQSQDEPEPQPQPQSKKAIPRPKYTNEIPQFLLDIDFPKEDERFQRASTVVDHLPPPPSLPQFLNKSILNGTTPHKDDASVLVMPNHTMLNHLATSSIKHGVLATSGTTRYKRKFLTTILYKPTGDEG